MFTEQHNEQAFRLSLLGATDEQMAEFWGVNQQTVDNWKKNAPGFLAALMRGKLEADANVANSMYQRAIGYSHPAVKIFMPAGADEPVYAPYTEHYPPDVAAGNNWLALRHRGKWAKQEGGLTVNINVDARAKPDADLNADLARMASRMAGAVTDVADEAEGGDE